MAWSHRKLEWDTAPMQSYLWHMDANLAIESGSRALGMPYIWWCAILQSNVKVSVSSSGKAMTGGVRDLLAGRFSGTKMAKLSDADECLLWRAWVSQAQTFSRTGETKLRTLDETSRCVLTSASSGDDNSKTTSPLPSIMMAFVSVSEVSLTSGASIIARNLWGWALKFSRDSSISCAKHQCSGGVECKIGLEASVSVTYVPARSIPILKRSDVISWRRPTRPFAYHFLHQKFDILFERWAILTSCHMWAQPNHLWLTSPQIHPINKSPLVHICLIRKVIPVGTLQFGYAA